MAGLRTFIGGVASWASGIWGSGAKAFPASSGRGEIPTGLTKDMKDLLTKLDHEEILNACRYVYNSFPMLSGAIDDKANVTIGAGWGPQFDGTEIEWGERAELWLYNHFKVCDVRGRPYDLQMDMHVASVTLDRDGEFFIHLFKTRNGYPMLQILEAHRIGNRYANTSYTGAQVRNGIAYNAYGRPLAYHFLGETREQDRWIPARDIIHVFDPKWFLQGRGISPIVLGLLDWLDVKETRENEKVAQRMFSTLALKETNEGGQVDPQTRRFAKTQQVVTNNAGQVTEVPVEGYKAGTKRFLKIGHTLEAFDAGDRPNMNQRAFEEGVLRGAFAAIGWSYEQSVNGSGLNGNQSRRDNDKNQRSADRRQMVLMYPWFRVAGWSVAVAIQLGLLPANPEWYAWIPQLPAKMTGDAGNMAKIELERLRIGSTTLKKICAANGDWWQEIRAQRQIEAVDAIIRAEEIVRDHPDVSFDLALAMIYQGTPNGNISTAKAEAKSGNEQKEAA
jgi:capsid protein